MEVEMVQVVKVPFTLDTVGKCKCPGCPVQAKSECVAGLKKGLNAALAKKPLVAADIPGAYCSAGTAKCTDLNPSAGCICGTCGIFSQYQLAKSTPVGAYCQNGMAR
jgi:hypothetical protein